MGQENGDDTFSELNRVEPGMNGGWVQIMGPLDRVAQFKAIETTRGAVPEHGAERFFGLQQVRWAPTNIADTPRRHRPAVQAPRLASQRPGVRWKFEVAPGGIGFLVRAELGGTTRATCSSAATPALRGGYLFRFDLEATARRSTSEDQRLRDRVADNLAKYDITESESLLFGRNFGVTPDVQEGPDGTLYVVSSSRAPSTRSANSRVARPAAIRRCRA